MTLAKDQVDEIMTGVVADMRQHSDAVLGKPHGPSRPVKGKAARIREAQAAGLLNTVPRDRAQVGFFPRDEFRLRPRIAKALATSRAADPGDVAAEVLGRLSAADREQALRVALQLCCYVVNAEVTGSSLPGIPSDW